MGEDKLGSLFDEVLRTIHTSRSAEFYVRRGDKHYSIYVSYDLGGYNYWTYQTDARGYYLSVRPMEISFNEDGTIMTRSYMMFEGRKMLLEEAKRYSKKRLGQLVEDILRDPEHPLVRRLFEIVLEHEEKE